MPLHGTSPEITRWLESMGFDLANLRRVCIVIDCGDVVRVYAQHIGDEKIFHEIPEGLRECIAKNAASTTPTTHTSADHAEHDLGAFDAEAS